MLLLQYCCSLLPFPTHLPILPPITTLMKLLPPPPPLPQMLIFCSRAISVWTPLRCSFFSTVVAADTQLNKTRLLRCYPATTVAVDVPCHIDRLHGSAISLKPPPFAVDVADAGAPLAAPPSILFRCYRSCLPPTVAAGRRPPSQPQERLPFFHTQLNKTRLLRCYPATTVCSTK